MIRAHALAAILSFIVLAPAAAARAEDTGIWVGLHAENGNHRSFRQFEPTTGETRTYDARVYGGIGVALGYEHWTTDSLVSPWISADYFRSLAFTSGARRLGRTVETVAQRMNAIAGLSLHPWGRERAPSFELLAGIGAMTFDFTMPEPDDEDDRVMQLATGNYTFFRAGLGARAPVSVLTLSVRGSYLLGLHTGDLGSRRVEGQPHGFEAVAAIEHRALSWLDVSVFGGLTAFWFDLAPLQARAGDAPANVRDLYVLLGLAAKARV